MHLRAPWLAALFCLALPAPSLFAQDSTDKEPSLPAPDLFAEYGTVISVEHLTPHLLEIINDPQLIYIVGEGAQPRWLNILRGQIERFAGAGPGRVEFGIDDGGQDLLRSALQMGLAAFTLVSALETQSPASPKVDRSSLHSYVNDLPRRGRLSLVAAELEQREILAMRESMAEWREMAGPAITSTETGIVLDLAKAVELFPLSALASQRLPMLGATPEQVEQAKRWLAGLQGEARLLTGDSWARADLFFGETAETTPFPGRDALLKQLGANSSEVLCRFDFAAFKESWKKLAAAVAAWRAAGFWDSPNNVLKGVIPGFDALDGILAMLPNEHRVSLDLGTTTRLVSLTSIKEGSWHDLRTSDLARCIPSDAEYYGLDGVRTLFESAFFVGFRRGFISGFTTNSPLRRLAERTTTRAVAELEEVFDIGWGWIVEAPRPTAVKARLGEQSVDWNSVPLPPMALLFRTHDPQPNIDMIRSALAEFGTENQFWENPSPVFVEKEVGLEVPTWVFDLKSFADRFDQDVSLSALDLETESANFLHTFRVGSVQVVSTSPALSRRIVNASRRPLAPAGDSAILVGHMQGPIQWAGQVVSQTLAWAASDDAIVDGSPRLAEMRKTLLELMDQGVDRWLEPLSRFKTSRTRVVEGTTLRFTHEIQVAPAPSPTISKLKPSAQKEIVSEKGLERLLARQQADGRFSDPDPEGLSDLALTALGLLVLEDFGIDARTHDRTKKAIDWLSQQQVTEGPYRGFVGNPEDDDAWEHQGMVVSSLLPRLSPAFPEHPVHERLIEFLTSSKVQREGTLEQAYWWIEVSTRKRSFERTLHLETETENALEDAFDHFRARGGALAEAQRASGPVSAISLEVVRLDLESGYAKLAKANLPRFFPDVVSDSPTLMSPGELRAIASLAEGSRKLSYSWIEAIASQKHRDKARGGWPHLPPPYHTEVSSTAVTLLILNKLNDEEGFQLLKPMRERVPEIYPDLDE